MLTKVFTEKYKEQAQDYNELLSCLAQKGGTTPNERVRKVEEVSEAYFDRVDSHMDKDQLARMADLILYDDLVNHNPHKMATEEYPIMSERQEKRRYLREVSFIWAETVASDGKDYRVMTRDSNRKLREVGL